MANGYPQDQYTDVNVTSIQGGGTLRRGTGTYNGTFFSCGPFEQIDLPVVGNFYNISGVNQGNRYEFPGWKCIHAGRTSDFQAA